MEWGYKLEGLYLELIFLVIMIKFCHYCRCSSSRAGKGSKWNCIISIKNLLKLKWLSWLKMKYIVGMYKWCWLWQSTGSNQTRSQFSQSWECKCGWRCVFKESQLKSIELGLELVQCWVRLTGHLWVEVKGTTKWDPVFGILLRIRGKLTASVLSSLPRFSCIISLLSATRSTPLILILLN